VWATKAVISFARRNARNVTIAKPIVRSFHAQVKSPLPRLREVKYTIDGTVAEYNIELWKAQPHLVVGRWVAAKGNSFGLPVGTFSWGVWPIHAGSCWGAYRIHDPAGNLIKYRFDALDNVRFAATETLPKVAQSESVEGVDTAHAASLSFDDLILDAWMRPPNLDDVRLEDEAELEAALVDGKLSLAQRSRVDAFRSALERPDELVRIVDSSIGENNFL